MRVAEARDIAHSLPTSSAGRRARSRRTSSRCFYASRASAPTKRPCRNLRSSVRRSTSWNAVLPRHARVSTASSRRTPVATRPPVRFPVKPERRISAWIAVSERSRLAPSFDAFGKHSTIRLPSPSSVNRTGCFSENLRVAISFLQLSRYHPETHDEALQEKMRGFHADARRMPALETWRAGRTGYPLVDAGMRATRRDRLDASARARGGRIVFVFRSRYGLARRTRRLGWPARGRFDRRWRPETGSGSPASAPTWRSFRASTIPNVSDGDAIRPASTFGAGFRELRHVPARAWHGSAARFDRNSRCAFSTANAYPAPVRRSRHSGARAS